MGGLDIDEDNIKRVLKKRAWTGQSPVTGSSKQILILLHLLHI
jgi:hypothetical protein